jgi:hypothetical protein
MGVGIAVGGSVGVGVAEGGTGVGLGGRVSAGGAATGSVADGWTSVGSGTSVGAPDTSVGSGTAVGELGPQPLRKDAINNIPSKLQQTYRSKLWGKDLTGFGKPVRSGTRPYF